MKEPKELDEILRTVVGSGLHGIAIDGTDDHDEMGVFVESADFVLGIGRMLDHDVWRTQPEGVRSGPGDIDLVRYSLRKYIRLAVKGNPTILLPLFAPPKDVLIETELGTELRALTSAIVSKQAGQRFLGYLRGQLSKVQTKKNRPELIEAYGYDTKYVSHALRLSMQGVELLETGRLTLPMHDSNRQRIIDIKSGLVQLSDVLAEIHSYELKLKHLIDSNDGPLRDHPDIPTINIWMVKAYRRHWEW